MACWRESMLGDLLTIKHGYALKGEYFADAGTHIVLTPGNFLDAGGFKYKESKEKWYSGPIPSEFVLEKGDLIVVMTEQAEGLLGSSALVPRSNLYLHNQRLGLVQIRDESATDKRFLYYLFNSKHVRQQIRATANGAKVRHTSPSRIAEVKVRVPVIGAQRKIAAILSAYDDLIENNTRRIKILEEMARLIYREWFVNFRFPGHEKVKIIDSRLGKIPEGWEISEIGELVGNIRETTNAGAHLSDLHYVPIDIIPRKSLALLESYPGSEAQSSLILFRKFDVLFGAMRAYFHKVIVAPFDGVTRTTCFVLRPKEPCMFSFVTLTLFEDSSIAYASAHSRGATMPYAVWNDVFENMRVIKPPIHVIERFDLLVRPILERIALSYFRQENLRRTRDLLLPKLISGEVDVEDLDINTTGLPYDPVQK